MAEHGGALPLLRYRRKKGRKKYDPTDRLLRFFHYPNKYEEEYEPRFRGSPFKIRFGEKFIIIELNSGIRSTSRRVNCRKTAPPLPVPDARMGRGTSGLHRAATKTRVETHATRM